MSEANGSLGSRASVLLLFRRDASPLRSLVATQHAPALRNTNEQYAGRLVQVPVLLFMTKVFLLCVAFHVFRGKKHPSFTIALFMRPYELEPTTCQRIVDFSFLIGRWTNAFIYDII